MPPEVQRELDDREKLPQRDVSAREFRRCAEADGWKESSIALFLKQPQYSRHVTVGGESLRLKPEPAPFTT